MNRSRFLALAVAAVIVLCGALYLGSRQNSAPPSVQGTAFLPKLGTELGSVTELDIRKGSPAPGVTLQRSGEQWTIAQRGGYPADDSKVRRFLLSLGDAKIVEAKTADPANFPLVGLDDPAKPGASGTEITLVAADGKHIVIIGKPIGEGNFVRRGGENQSYSVQPGIFADAEPRSWIDSKLIDVSTSTIQSVELKPSSGAGYVLHRIKGGDGFALEGKPPAGRKLLDANALAPSPSALSGLDADDVSAASSLDFSKPSQAIFTLSDGGVVTITGAPAGDKRWIEVQATKSPALAAKAQNRAFEIASYRYDAIFRPLDQLLVAKEEPKASAKGAGGAAAKGAARQPAAGKSAKGTAGVRPPAPQSSAAPPP